MAEVHWIRNGFCIQTNLEMIMMIHIIKRKGNASPPSPDLLLLFSGQRSPRWRPTEHEFSLFLHSHNDWPENLSDIQTAARATHAVHRRCEHSLRLLVIAVEDFPGTGNGLSSNDYQTGCTHTTGITDVVSGMPVYTYKHFCEPIWEFSQYIHFFHVRDPNMYNCYIFVWVKVTQLFG